MLLFTSAAHVQSQIEIYSLKLDSKKTAVERRIIVTRETKLYYCDAVRWFSIDSEMHINSKNVLLYSELLIISVCLHYFYHNIHSPVLHLLNFLLPPLLTARLSVLVPQEMPQLTALAKWKTEVPIAKPVCR